MIFLRTANNRKDYPTEVNSHYYQMYNTIRLLQASNLVKEYIDPEIKTITKEKNKKQITEYQITWKFDAQGINEKNFLSIKAYQKVSEAKSYQLVLFDNSIIRCSMKFNKDGELISQNFSYIPCPLNCNSINKEDEKKEVDDEEVIEISIDDVADSLAVGILEVDRILMRTAVRFDYDANNDTEEHPANHVHLQSPGTRIMTNGPICFNKFIKHILEGFYPQSYFTKKKILSKEQYEVLSNIDFIKKIKTSCPQIKYSIPKVEYRL